jgi:hypothetical protein
MMNSFQSTPITVNFFTGSVTSGRFGFSRAGTNTNAPANDSPSLDTNKVALGRMREVLEDEDIRLNPNAQPHSATDVAEHVLQRVSAALAAAPDDEARIALLEKAAEGIAQGIAEARQILGQADVLTGKVAETVGAIADKLQAGLLVQRRASISINTQDGDVISLDFNCSAATAVAVEPATATPRIADAAIAVGEVAQVVDLAAQQCIIADPQTAVPNLIGTVARAKGFAAPINPLGQSFSEALGLLRDLIADLVLPTAEGDAASGETEDHHEHGEDRDDE